MAAAYLDQPAPSGSLLRLCETKPGELFEHSHSSTGTAVVGLLGTAVCAKWDPTHPRRLGILYSSGVLRLWDCALDVYRDFALYLPSSGLPFPQQHDELGLTPAALHIGDRRAATAITHFDFVPLLQPKEIDHVENGAPLPRVVVAVQRSRTLLLADLPRQALPGSDHYLSGSRVYELPTQLPAPVTTLTTWRVAAVPAAIAAIAVGCEDGHVGVWLASGAFNPEPLVSMRSRRIASPAFLHAGLLGGGIASAAVQGGSFALTPVEATAATAAADNASASTATASADVRVWLAGHGGRVRVLAPLRVKPSVQAAEEALQAAAAAAAPPGASAAASMPGLRTGAHAMGAAAAAAHRQVHAAGARAGSGSGDGASDAGIAETVFLSSADDGRVKLWRIVVSPPSSPMVPAPSASFLRQPATPALPSSQQAALPASGFSVRLEDYGSLPTDTSPVTALSSVAWPLLPAGQSGTGGSLTSAGSAAAAAAAARLPMHRGWGGGMLGSAADSGHALRSLVACGNRDGVLTVWEVLLPAGDCAVMVTQPSVVSDGQSPAPRSLGLGLGRAHPRLLGMVAARDYDPLTGVAIAPPPLLPAPPAGDAAAAAAGSDPGHRVVAAGADGSVSVYRLEGGSEGAGSGVAGALGFGLGPASDRGAPGSAGPVTLVFQGAAAAPPDAVADTSAYDALRSHGREAAALAALVGETGEAASAGDEDVPGYAGARRLLSATASAAAATAASHAAGDRRALSSAITAAALARLRRSAVACSFNEWSLAPADAGDAAAAGALMVCNGAGEVLLWPAGGLPGEPTDTTDVSIADDVRHAAAGGASGQAAGADAEGEGEGDLDSVPQPRVPPPAAAAAPPVPSSSSSGSSASPAADPSLRAALAAAMRDVAAEFAAAPAALFSGSEGGEEAGVADRPPRRSSHTGEAGSLVSHSAFSPLDASVPAVLESSASAAGHGSRAGQRKTGYSAESSNPASSHGAWLADLYARGGLTAPQLRVLRETEGASEAAATNGFATAHRSTEPVPGSDDASGGSYDLGAELASDHASLLKNSRSSASGTRDALIATAGTAAGKRGALGLSGSTLGPAARHRLSGAPAPPPAPVVSTSSLAALQKQASDAAQRMFQQKGRRSRPSSKDRDDIRGHGRDVSSDYLSSSGFGLGLASSASVFARDGVGAPAAAAEALDGIDGELLAYKPLKSALRTHAHGPSAGILNASGTDPSFGSFLGDANVTAGPASSSVGAGMGAAHVTADPVDGSGDGSHASASTSFGALRRALNLSASSSSAGRGHNDQHGDHTDAGSAAPSLSMAQHLGTALRSARECNDCGYSGVGASAPGGSCGCRSERAVACSRGRSRIGSVLQQLAADAEAKAAAAIAGHEVAPKVSLGRRNRRGSKADMTADADIDVDVDADADATSVGSASVGAASHGSRSRRRSSEQQRRRGQAQRNERPPGSSPGSVASAHRVAHSVTSGAAGPSAGRPALAPDPAFRNPARLAATLLRESREDTRVAVRLAREAATAAAPGVENTGDDHPDARELFARLRREAGVAATAGADGAGAGAGGEGPGAEEASHHLLAPVVGSSALIAQEIERVQALQFDEEAALAAALRRCHAEHDRRIAGAARRQLHAGRVPAGGDFDHDASFGEAHHAGDGHDGDVEQGEGEGEGEEEEFAYMPSPSLSSAAGSKGPGAKLQPSMPASVPSSAADAVPTAAAARKARLERLMRPLAGHTHPVPPAGPAGGSPTSGSKSSGKGKTSHSRSDTVSASDLVRWHFALRGGGR